MTKLVDNRKNIAVVFAFTTAMFCLVLLFSRYKVCFVRGVSMEPTILENSFILIDTAVKPERGDIAVFSYCGKTYIKRVVGCSGDVVELEGTTIKVNTELMRDNLKADYGEFMWTIPLGSYLMLGDNENESYDARFWENPFISEKDVKGVVLKVW